MALAYTLRTNLQNSFSIYKTVEKVDAVVAKVLVCMEDDCIFLKFCV